MMAAGSNAYHSLYQGNLLGLLLKLLSLLLKEKETFAVGREKL